MACARSRTDEGDCASGQSWFSFSLPDFPLKSTLVFCWRGRVTLFSSPPHKPQVKESILALAASGRRKKGRAQDANCVPGSAWWRKRWDSNPRALADYLISSQARYDHFDTLPSSRRRVIRSGQYPIFYRILEEMSREFHLCIACKLVCISPHRHHKMSMLP